MGSLVVQGGVFALCVVVSFDEGKDLGAGIVFIQEAAALEHLGFERSNEGFRTMSGPEPLLTDFEIPYEP